VEIALKIYKIIDFLKRDARWNQEWGAEGKQIPEKAWKKGSTYTRGDSKFRLSEGTTPRMEMTLAAICGVTGESKEAVDSNIKVGSRGKNGIYSSICYLLFSDYFK